MKCGDEVVIQKLTFTHSVAGGAHFIGKELVEVQHSTRQTIGHDRRYKITKIQPGLELWSSEFQSKALTTELLELSGSGAEDILSIDSFQFLTASLV